MCSPFFCAVAGAWLGTVLWTLTSPGTFKFESHLSQNHSCENPDMVTRIHQMIFEPRDYSYVLGMWYLYDIKSAITSPDPSSSYTFNYYCTPTLNTHGASPRSRHYCCWVSASLQRRILSDAWNTVVVLQVRCLVPLRSRVMVITRPIAGCVVAGRLAYADPNLKVMLIEGQLS